MILLVYRFRFWIDRNKEITFIVDIRMHKTKLKQFFSEHIQPLYRRLNKGKQKFSPGWDEYMRKLKLNSRPEPSLARQLNSKDVILLLFNMIKQMRFIKRLARKFHTSASVRAPPFKYVWDVILFIKFL